VDDLLHTLGPMSVIYLFKNFTYILIQVLCDLLRCTPAMHAL
jgi:hypothetical protein